VTPASCHIECFSAVHLLWRNHLEGMIVETLRLILLFVHLVGMAGILGAFLSQARGRRVAVPDTAIAVMFYGAIVQLVTGAALVNVLIAQDHDYSHLKFVVKTAISTAVLVTAWLARRRDGQHVFFYATGLLALIITGVSVFWT
jgi:hypothetical protein